MSNFLKTAEIDRNKFEKLQILNDLGEGAKKTISELNNLEKTKRLRKR